MPVFHTIKKKAAFAASPIFNPPNNAEYEDYRQRLDSIKRSMIGTLASINDNARRFNKLYISIRNFSERFVENYPVEDEDIKATGRECEEEAQELWEHFVKETGDWVTYKRIHKQIQVYIDEIKAIESKYFELKSRKVEMERYQSKLDRIALIDSEPQHEGIRGRVDDVVNKTRGDVAARKSRNMLKLKRARTRYLDYLTEVVAAQKHAYSKHEIVFRAALAAYWLAHDSHVSCLLKSLNQTINFAHDNEIEMLHLDVPNMEVSHLIKTRQAESPTNVRADDIFHDARDSETSSSHLSVKSFGAVEIGAKEEESAVVEKANSMENLGGSDRNTSSRTKSEEQKLALVPA